MQKTIHFLPESLATSAGGAKRWIRLPFFSLAPVEFFKIGFIVFLAWSFSRKFSLIETKSLKEEFITFLPYAFVFLIAVYLIAILQNDLGQIVLLGATLALMMIFAGSSFKLFVNLLAIAFVLFISVIIRSEFVVYLSIFTLILSATVVYGFKSGRVKFVYENQKQQKLNKKLKRKKII